MLTVMRFSLLISFACSMARCSPGSNCTYSETVGSVTVSNVGTETSNGCVEVAYQWPASAPSRFPAFDRARLKQQCVNDQQLVTGTVLEVRRRDAETGACTPSIHQFVKTDLEACRCDD